MLGVLPVVEDPDLSWSAAPALPQHLPPWWSIMKECTILPMKHESLKQASKLCFCRRRYYAQACDCIGKLIRCKKTLFANSSSKKTWYMLILNWALFCLRILHRFIWIAVSAMLMSHCPAMCLLGPSRYALLVIVLVLLIQLLFNRSIRKTGHVSEEWGKEEISFSPWGPTSPIKGRTHHLGKTKVCTT